MGHRSGGDGGWCRHAIILAADKAQQPRRRRGEALCITLCRMVIGSAISCLLSMAIDFTVIETNQYHAIFQGHVDH
jgi:hypothetical protein